MRKRREVEKMRELEGAELLWSVWSVWPDEGASDGES